LGLRRSDIDRRSMMAVTAQGHRICKRGREMRFCYTVTTRSRN